MTKNEIQELMDAFPVFPVPRAEIVTRDHLDWRDANEALRNSARDIAQTALSLYDRVSELEKIIARHKELGIGENV